MRPDLSQRVAFTCPECQTKGLTNLGATEEVEEVEVTCDYCQRVGDRRTRWRPRLSQAGHEGISHNVKRQRRSGPAAFGRERL